MNGSDVYCSWGSTFKKHVCLVPIFCIPTGWTQTATRLGSHGPQTWLCVSLSWRVVQTQSSGPALHSFWCSVSKMQCYNGHLHTFPGDVALAGLRTTLWGLEKPCDGKESGPLSNCINKTTCWSWTQVSIILATLYTGKAVIVILNNIASE